MGMREEFEAWAQGFYAVPDFTRWDDTYLAKHIRQSWSAWQASRTALFIELPDYIDAPLGAYEANVIHDILTGAGVSYR
jgi:hypothetical protein